MTLISAFVINWKGAIYYIPNYCLKKAMMNFWSTVQKFNREIQPSFRTYLICPSLISGYACCFFDYL